MAAPPQQPQQGFSAFAAMGAKMALKAALNLVLNNRNLIDHIAGRMYEDETMKNDWAKKTPADRALWHQRVQSVILGLSGIVGL